MPRAITFNSSCAVAVMILGPPDAPATAYSFPSRVTMVGDIDDSGRFPAAMKLASWGARP